jgi:hypothetical protein
MNQKDQQVGTTVDDSRPVFQCVKTGLLYYYADPPKRYTSVTDVLLGKERKEVINERTRRRNAC